MYEKQVPDGVEDCLPEECAIKRDIENRLRSEFYKSGYDEIETPAYEYYDVFQGGVGSYMQESMIKFIDPKGRILVLRPDITVPIARVAATKLGGGVKRLFYIQDSFSCAEPAAGKAGQFTQAGVELIGDAAYQADAEVIALAVRALKTAGLREFTIDIGQVAFFKGLINGLQCNDNQADELRHAVDSKDIGAIESAAEKIGMGAYLKEKILRLPGLFGKKEVFDEALSLSDSGECAAAVENLRNVYALLESLGLEEHISVDLGILHDIAYYSGIIFRGITPGIGFPVVSGGRYDGLLERFGEPAAATGFALGIKRVMIAMERQGLLKGGLGGVTVVSCAAPQCGIAAQFADSLKARGKRAVLYAGLSKDETKAFKNKTGAAEAVYIGPDGAEERL